MNIVYICTVLIIRMFIMKNKFTSFINTMLVLLPISLVIVSCKKEEEDKQQDNAPSHVEAVDLGGDGVEPHGKVAGPCGLHAGFIGKGGDHLTVNFIYCFHIIPPG